MSISFIDISGYKKRSESISEFDFNVQKSPIKSQLLRQMKQAGFKADSVYFSGDFPSIFFKRVNNFEKDSLREILEIQRQIWNQGRVAMLYVESDFEIRVYSCYEKPPQTDSDLGNIFDSESKIRIASFQNTEKDLKTLIEVFGRVSIDSGKFWDNNTYSTKLKHEKRVHQALIGNLKITKNKLQNTGIVDIDIIHGLLLRSMFLLYLEDRGATEPSFYAKYLKSATSYFDILNDYKATYSIFEILEEKFNGNLSPISDTERVIVNESHLKIIKECFWDVVDDSAQLTLFSGRAFDFKHIPIELISEIYEQFLEEKDGKNDKAKKGAYYTPRPLAEFILNKVLPYPTKNENHNFNVKILDPTCGSGIFLVESLNRLLDRWEISNPNKKIDFQTIIKIAKENIFGVEINKEAIKVAAFSLYLAMLDRLNPKNLWNEEQFPYLIFDSESKKVKDRKGGNLFRMSSLGSGDFENIEYDLIVGNPPWKKNGLESDAKSYLSQLGYPQELAVAFLHRATRLSSHAKIALISTSKILFNNEKSDLKFREDFFNKFHVSEIYNFSILRMVDKKRGGNLFASAVGPACICFYSAKAKVKTIASLRYCAPRTAISVLGNRLIDGIIIDPSDVKYLPIEECKKPSSNIWKVAMWGTERDHKLINKYSKLTKYKVVDAINTHSMKGSVGLEVTGKKNFKNEEIKNLPHILPCELTRYSVKSKIQKRISSEFFYREGSIDTYKAPHLLIREGIVENRLCVAMLRFDCSFPKSIYGISGGDEKIQMLLSAFLNSKVVSYYLLMTSSSWGIDRPRVKPYEIKRIPDLVSQLPNEVKSQLLNILNQDVSFMATEESLESSIDSVLLNSIGFTENDKILIKDSFDFKATLLTKKKIKGTPNPYNPTTLIDSKKYASLLVKEVNNFLRNSKLICWASVYSVSPKVSLNIVSIYFNNTEVADTVNESEESINDLLGEIDKYTYREFSESIYFRKSIRYYDKDRLHIIYPNEKRFWTEALALNEADKIISEILNSEEK